MIMKIVEDYSINSDVYEKYFNDNYNEIVNGDINQYSIEYLLEKTYGFIPEGELEEDGCCIHIDELVDRMVRRLSHLDDMTEIYQELDGYYIKDPERYVSSVCKFYGDELMLNKQIYSLRGYIESIVFTVMAELVINKIIK